MNTGLRRIVGLMIGTGLLPLTVAAAPAPKPLKMPPEAQTLETAVRAIGGLTSESGLLLLLPEEGDAPLLRLKFHPEGTTRAAQFGGFSAQERGHLAAKKRWAHLVGAAILPNRTLFLDGADLSLIEAEPEALTEVIRRTLPWDRLKPPADRGGEPTQPETAALRATFKRRWLETAQPRVTGMAELPRAWQKDQGRTFLLATRAPDYPVVQVACPSQDEASACAVSRACFVEGTDDLKAEAVTGLAISQARRLVVVGDAAQHRLLVFRYDSCFNLSRQATLLLPAQLKRLTNIHIDAGDRLWASFAAADDYLNASVVYWQPSEW